MTAHVAYSIEFSPAMKSRSNPIKAANFSSTTNASTPAQSFIAELEIVRDVSWYMTFGATDHVTSSSSN